jgi:hypothetical protein
MRSAAVPLALAIGMLAMAGRDAIERGGATPISHLPQGERDLIVLGLFALMLGALVWMVRAVSAYQKSPEKLNVYHVDRAAVKRLDAQARGEDPPPAEEPPRRTMQRLVVAPPGAERRN